MEMDAPSQRKNIVLFFIVPASLSILQFSHMTKKRPRDKIPQRRTRSRMFPAPALSGSGSKGFGKIFPLSAGSNRQHPVIELLKDPEALPQTPPKGY
jgi:hypothetical protein